MRASARQVIAPMQCLPTVPAARHLASLQKLFWRYAMVSWSNEVVAIAVALGAGRLWDQFRLHLIHPDPRLLHHKRPSVHVVLDESTELSRRARRGSAAFELERLLNVGRGERLDDLLVDARDDIRRNLGWC